MHADIQMIYNLLSDIRKTLAGALNAETGESEEGMSFENFIYVILHGPVELAEYIQQNHLEGQSLGIDTGKKKKIFFLKLFNFF